MHIIETPRHVVRFFRELRQKPDPRLAYISGCVGGHNLGDEVLPHAMGALFSPFSLVPFRGERSIAWINRISHSVQGGVLGGGTLINSGRHHLECMDKSTRLLPNVFVFGSGIRDPDFWRQYDNWEDNRRDWADVLKRCEFVGVRGPISAGLLEDVGVSAEIVGDPALAFFDGTRALDYQDSELCLGLNVGQSLGNVWGSEDHIIRQYVILARKARECGWRVTWFVVCPEDLEATKRVAEESSTSQDIFLEYCSAERYMEKARKMTLFAGMKLHATVLAICAGVPSLMIEYRPKCRDFMQSVNLEEATIRSDVFLGAEAFEMLQNWSDNIDQHRLKLTKEVGFLAKKQRQRAREITGQILSGRELRSFERITGHEG